MNIYYTIFSIISLLFAITFHEFAHVWAAWKLGDDTAANEGRLSFNPKNHIDLIGTIIFPALLILIKSDFVFGWAKPVPINPHRFKKVNIGIFITSLSGPAANLFLALFFSFFIKLFFLLEFRVEIIIYFFEFSVMCNIFLAFFNLIPIYPLDGYKVVTSMMPLSIVNKMKKIEPYGFIIILFFLYFGVIEKIIMVPFGILIDLLI